MSSFGRTAGGLMLDSLYHYRLLTTTQLARLTYPPLGARRVRQLLSRLESGRYVESVHRHGSKERAWFLTQRGALEVESVGHEGRRSMTANRAIGQRQTHMLEVSEIGVMFDEMAQRQPGAEAVWRCEVKHSLGSDAKTGETAVKPDAVLRYADHSRWHFRFVEVDRNTEEIARWTQKLEGYCRLYSRGLEFAPGGPIWTWRRWYGEFPELLVVMSGERRRRDREATDLYRRMQEIVTQGLHQPEIASGGVRVRFVLMEHLLMRGLDAPIFVELLNLGRLTDWRGGREEVVLEAV